MSSFTFKQECGRKLIHLSSLWMPLSIGFFGSQIASVLFLIALGAVALFEVLRRQQHALGRMLSTVFTPILRSFELSDSPKLTGAAYMLMGAVLVTSILPPDVAMTSLTVLMISDTVAALIGKRWGKHAIAGKSIEGSTAFFLSAIVIIAVLGVFALRPYVLFFITGCIACLAATLVELYTAHIRIDDNLSIPISFALTQTAFIFLFG